MLSKSDTLSLLYNLEKRGVNVDAYMRKLLVSKEVPVEVLKFIAQNQGIEAANFYEMLRKKHNENKSPLYTNILADDLDDSEVLVTLTSLMQQIALYGRKLQDKDRFFKEIRAEEISRVLNSYFANGELETGRSLLWLVRKDLMVLEYLADHRDLQ